MQEQERDQSPQDQAPQGQTSQDRDQNQAPPDQEQDREQDLSEHPDDYYLTGAGVPHEATRFRASNGAGTVSGPPPGETQDRPILDGASEGESDRDVQNPRRGMENPELVRHPETGEETPTPDEES